VGDPLFLPKAAEAVVSPAKLRDYALSRQHPRGRHKARVFEAALGISAGDWEYLREQILQRVGRSPVVVLSTAHPHGTIYTVPMPIEGLNGATHQIITAWIVEPAEPPRLTSVYVDIP
jgi:hypothetical protein